MAQASHETVDQPHDIGLPVDQRPNDERARRIAGTWL